MSKVGTLVEFNRGAGPEYGLVAEKDDEGAGIVPLGVKVGSVDVFKAKLSADASPGGGEYSVVSGQ